MPRLFCVHVAWADGEGERDHYVGRTSHVVEYIGATRIKGSIRFVPPSSLGMDEAALARDGSICICARIGQVSPAIDAGWLLHHVFPVAGGSEMRSYFWLGGRTSHRAAVARFQRRCCAASRRCFRRRRACRRRICSCTVRRK